MGSSSRVTKKRKGDVEDDGTDEGRRTRERRYSSSRSRSTSPKGKRFRRREKESSPSAPTDDNSESLSVEETNKLRAKLGLAPLEVADKPKTRDAEDGSKVVVEDGFEFRHKKAENWGDKKKEQEMKEKLEAAKMKRQVYEKVLKTKGLADTELDGDALSWVNKMRKQEEEKRRAEERAKMLDAMDEEFGVNSIIADEKAKQAKAKAKQLSKQKAKHSDTGGLLIGHSKQTFAGVADQILVLEDKDVLDEGEETLINPNLLENERHARNVELKKRKCLQRGFDEDLDEFGNPKSFGVLAKYDEELEGVQKEKFRLDESGGYDLDKEDREAQIRRQLEMAGKMLVSLDTPKYKMASEFYTQEEMIAFRKVKKGKKEKSRKRGKILKADDLIPDERTEMDIGSRNRNRRHHDGFEGETLGTDGVKQEINEEGEVRDLDNSPWKKATKGSVNIDMLMKLSQYNSDEEESEEELVGGTNLAGVILEDDAADELTGILDKARKLKLKKVKYETDPDSIAKRVHDMMSSHDVKVEVDEDCIQPKEGVMCIDSTMEYCRNIGDIPTYGLAGNRTDAIAKSGLNEENLDGDDDVHNQVLKRWKQSQIDRELHRREKTKKKESKGGWLEQGSSGQLDSDDEREIEEYRAEKVIMDSGSDEEDKNFIKKEYENVLGNEADVSKGVGAMLKLAAQKGYLNDPDVKKHSGQNLDHLRNQSKTQIEQGKYDIEDKYAKKLDRLGTTGRGPIQSFPEKKDYNPEVVIQYVDEKGRLMDSKDAYRELSYKFHGRNPGKKQTEKRMMRRDKKEMLKQMNSSDTPLGTLTKQLKKQEQLQTPYLVLSGSGRSDHTSIKKE